MRVGGHVLGAVHTTYILPTGAVCTVYISGILLTLYNNILSIYCSNIQSTSPGHGSRNICVLWAMQFKTSSPGGSEPEKSVDAWTKSLEMFHLALSKSRWDGSCVSIYIYKLVPLGGQLLWRDLRVVNPLPPHPPTDFPNQDEDISRTNETRSVSTEPWWEEG